jgi:hypothetical protein
MGRRACLRELQRLHCLGVFVRAVDPSSALALGPGIECLLALSA